MASEVPYRRQLSSGGGAESDASSSAKKAAVRMDRANSMGTTTPHFAASKSQATRGDRLPPAGEDPGRSPVLKDIYGLESSTGRQHPH